MAKLTLSMLEHKIDDTNHKVKNIKQAMDIQFQEMKDEHKIFKTEIDNFKLWKAVTATKLTMFSGLSIFIGTIISQLIINFLT